MMYLDALGRTIRNEIDPTLLPSGDTDSLFRIYAVLVLAKGLRVNAQDVHNAWAAWMSDREPHHPAIRPYEELDTSRRQEDEPYVAALRRVAARLSSGGPPAE